jgi:hypothetical protein
MPSVLKKVKPLFLFHGRDIGVGFVFLREEAIFSCLLLVCESRDNVPRRLKQSIYYTNPGGIRNLWTLRIFETPLQYPTQSKT